MPGFAKSHWIYQRCQLSTTKFSGNHAHRKTENYLSSSPDELLRDLAPPWTPDAYTLYFYSVIQHVLELEAHGFLKTYFT
ncbi:hypothetical protein HPB50_008119 [Hyalomma asiaticum]|uniref:Uncharacterized protein n=1 Tax=Hyalomma asiaticum TaxID=266040 RepID=A0ACB7S8Q9_HYAAI|nr:hypothetical protein HPB50_008119 [Hyalomma asiaticum]